MKRLLTVFVLFFGIVTRSQGQDNLSIDFTADSLSFSELVKKIESQSVYRIYFTPDLVDSIYVKSTVNQATLSSILEIALSGSNLHYAIVGHDVFITEGVEIVKQLPSDFFNYHQPVRAKDTVKSDQNTIETKKTIPGFLAIGNKTNQLDGSAVLSGIVRERSSGEPIIGASVFVEQPLIGVATNELGIYSLTLPKGRHLVKVKSIGMKDSNQGIMLYSNGKLDISLDEEITPLKEVVVESERDINVTNVQMGRAKLDIKTMKQIPLALGEVDVMKAILTLPGVQSVGEGTVGLNVRGGATNQNLILYNDAVVYNPSHLFGFFSTFNSDVVKSVELLKSGVGAEYGGRLSSVLDIKVRDGNNKNFKVSGGISPITGRLTIEGPIVKDKTSFLLGMRSTYSDWLLRLINNKNLKNSDGSFYDVNLALTHKINDQNSLSFSGYLSSDMFKLNRDTSYRYSDQNASLKWKRNFNSRLFGVLTLANSKYKYSVEFTPSPTAAAKLDFSINQMNAKVDFNYILSSRHNASFGASIIRYDISPGNYQPIGSGSKISPKTIQNEQALEGAIYAGDNFDINPNLSLYFGLRLSFYQNLGERNVYTYLNNVPRQESTMQDTVHYSNGQPIAPYYGFEPRISVRYNTSKSSSVKFSFNRMRQYINMLSNTTASNPTDIWKLSDSYIPPQIGNQFSIGYYKNLRGHQIETSIEAYYKITEDGIDFKDGAQLLLNDHIETDVLKVNGKAYGVEFLLKKASGKLNGWISYTYSRSLLQTQSDFSTETINGGGQYPSSYDKPHSVNFIGNYKFSRRFSFSLNMVYSTGRPITLPIAKYELGGAQRVYYSERNEYRIPDYFRTDISLNLEGNHLIKKLAHSSWTFSVYNLFSNPNAYSVYFTSQNGLIKGYKLSIFAQAIPTITYNFKF